MFILIIQLLVKKQCQEKPYKWTAVPAFKNAYESDPLWTHSREFTCHHSEKIDPRAADLESGIVEVEEGPQSPRRPFSRWKCPE